MTAGREAALADIVLLARTNGLSTADIAAVLDPSVSSPAARAASSGIALRVFGYLGGIFIFAGLSAYIGMFWHDMNSAMRVLITLGSGFIAYIIALLAAREGRRSAAPLFLIAGVLEPAGLFIAIQEYSLGGPDMHAASLLVFSALLLQQVLTFRAVKQAVPLCLTLAFGALAFVTLLDMMHVSPGWNSLCVGLPLLLASYGLGRTPYRHITGFWYFFGAVSFLGGTFDVLQHTPAELLYLGVACFMVYVSTLAHSTTLLVVSVLAMLWYIGYFTEQHFLHSVGWPVALIMLGLSFFAVSIGAVKIKKKYIVA